MVLVTFTYFIRRLFFFSLMALVYRLVKLQEKNTSLTIILESLSRYPKTKENTGGNQAICLILRPEHLMQFTAYLSYFLPWQ